MSKIIGIDLGTTNSCVAVMEGGQPVVIASSEGMRTTPSIVGFTKANERLVGETAKRQAITNPDHTIASIKRKMGTDFKVNINGKDYSPQEISGMILQKLKTDAESYLGETVTKAVITVPAYFTDSQRQATKDAGRIAGLEVERIINEPTAAALSYGLDNEKEQKIMVYDLGGDDFDDRVMKYLIEEFKKLENMDLSQDKMAVQRLKEAAEKAKRELSTVTTTNINLPFITMNQDGPKHMDINLTRAKFDELTHDLVESTMGPVRTALSDSDLTASDLSKVLLVGGSTRIPAVQEAVKKLTGQEPFKGINPDECVALGASIQGAKLSGDEGAGSILLLDVTPLSLGIETLGGVATKLIERNTTIPTNKSQVFSTAENNQSAVDVHVVQGERQLARDNKTLGQFRLDGIAPAPRGVPQIEVTFDIDANGIVNVSAKDLGTGKEQKITITASTNMSDAEIDQAIKDAEIYAEQDRIRKDAIDAKNEADSLLFQTEKLLTDMGDKVDATDKSTLEGEMAKLRQVSEPLSIETMNESDTTMLKSAIEAYTKVLNDFSTKLYQQAGAQAGGPDVGPQPEGFNQNFDENIVDGEFTEEVK